MGGLETIKIADNAQGQSHVDIRPTKEDNSRR